MIPHADPIVVNVITTLYFVFALQVLAQIRGQRLDRRTAGALLPLVATFVLCGLAGYASTILHASFWTLREAMHWALAASATWLVLTNQARVLAELLCHD